MKILFGMVRPDAGGIVFKGRELTDRRRRAKRWRRHRHDPPAFHAGRGDDGGRERAARLATSRACGSTCARRRDAGARGGAALRPRLDPNGPGRDACARWAPAGRDPEGDPAAAPTCSILDEPTSILSPPEVAATARRFCERFGPKAGRVVFITHKLGEVLAGGDGVVVLRDGAVSGERCDVRRDARGARPHDGRPRDGGSCSRTDSLRTLPGRCRLEVEGSATPMTRSGDAPTQGRQLRRCAPAKCWRSPASTATARPNCADTLAGMLQPARRAHRCSMAGEHAPATASRARARRRARLHPGRPRRARASCRA